MPFGFIPAAAAPLVAIASTRCPLVPNNSLYGRFCFTRRRAEGALVERLLYRFAQRPLQTAEAEGKSSRVMQRPADTQSHKAKIAALAAALLIIAAGGVWYFASPAWTLKEMRDAARANNADALNAYVDYPALRANVKSELTTQMVAKARNDQSGFGSLGVAIGSALMGPLIDRMVSPAGVRAALIAERNRQNSTTATTPLRVPDQPVIVRRGFSEFVVTNKDKRDGGLVFKRHGLSWQLSGIELPPS